MLITPPPRRAPTAPSGRVGDRPVVPLFPHCPHTGRAGCLAFSRRGSVDSVTAPTSSPESSNAPKTAQEQEAAPAPLRFASFAFESRPQRLRRRSSPPRHALADPSLFERSSWERNGGFFPLISAVMAERFDLSARRDEVGSSIATVLPTGKAFFSKSLLFTAV